MDNHASPVQIARAALKAYGENEASDSIQDLPELSFDVRNGKEKVLQSGENRAIIFQESHLWDKVREGEGTKRENEALGIHCPREYAGNVHVNSDFLFPDLDGPDFNVERMCLTSNIEEDLALLTGTRQAPRDIGSGSARPPVASPEKVDDVLQFCSNKSTQESFPNSLLTIPGTTAVNDVVNLDLNDSRSFDNLGVSATSLFRNYKQQYMARAVREDNNSLQFSDALQSVMRIEGQDPYSDVCVLSSDDDGGISSASPAERQNCFQASQGIVDLTDDAPFNFGTGHALDPSISIPFGLPYREQEGYTNQSLKELMEKNNLTADATEEDPTPPELATELMAHQRRALRWMKRRETMDPSVRGGILADDQGLGKTLSTIALVVSNKPPPAPVDEDGNVIEDSDSEACNDFPTETSSLSDCSSESSVASLLPPPSDRDDSEDDEPTEASKDVKTVTARWRTLIVCPVSLVHQWKEELERRIRAECVPSIYVYHGKTKTQDVNELKKHDIVITTYATLAMQYPKVDKKHPHYKELKSAKRSLPRRPPGAMYKLCWFRVILDEAQNVKNRFTENFQAVNCLRARHRWCLTGTPIQNSTDDLYSLFLFIRYRVVDNYKAWQRVWKKKLENPNARIRENAFKRFQTVVGVVLLRRTKLDTIDDKPLISLPKRNVELLELDFKDSDEEANYRSVQVRSLLAVNKFLVTGTLNNNYSNILLLLLRLRQAATHPGLIHSFENSYDLSSFANDSSKQGVLHFLCAKFGARVVQPFTSGEPLVCSSCQTSAESVDCYIVSCGHIFCPECTPKPCITCPECQLCVENSACSLEEVYLALKGYLDPQQEIKQEASESLAERTPNDQAVDGNRSFVIKPETPHLMQGCSEEVLGKRNFPDPRGTSGASMKRERGVDRKKCLSSTKLETLLGELESIRKRSKEEKSLVFSQWTSMLDIIERALHERSFKTCRLDGRMPMGLRKNQLEMFKRDNNYSVMLISLHAGGTGLNLTVAQNVFIFDVWWNPAVEEQAIDRAHRIGQRSDVRVVKMKIRGTVEERIYELSAKKRELMDGALGVSGSQSLGRKKLSMREIMYLFGGAAEEVLNTTGDVNPGWNTGSGSEAAQAAANILAYAQHT